ncbi:MAG: DHA2 family efflux MFS transporter permease subunit [Deltaproteobacteria bacterium]|nr:DHA2 family efflux MFS transporter permease subunit [Deltaproteobacteria bacterium]
MLGSFTSLLTSSVVNVAIPRIMSTFGIGRDQAEWISTSYMLTSAVAMPLVGWMVNRFGHKVFYLCALALFISGTAACALAWDFNSLIVARVIQAFGGGAMMPAGMAMVALLFKPEERGRAMGFYSMGIMVAPALGPTLGGYLTELISWRAVFSLNLPFGLITLIMGTVLISNKTSVPGVRRPFDWWGYIFLSMGVIGGLLAFSDGQEKGWTSTYIVANSACAIIGMTMFLAVEATTRHPILDLNIFKFRNYSFSMALSVVRSVGLFGGMFFLPLFLQNLSGFTPIKSGLWMMPVPITMAVAMPIAGRLSDRYDARLLSVGGALTAGLSLMAYYQLDPLSSRAVILIPQFFRGIGLAFMMAPLMAVAINSVPLAMVPTATSFLSVGMSLGGSFGISMLNTSISNSVANHAARLSEQVGANSKMFTHLSQRMTLNLGRYPSSQTSGIRPFIGLAVPLQQIAIRAQVLGFQDAFVLSGFILLLAIPLCLMLKPGFYQEPAKA